VKSYIHFNLKDLQTVQGSKAAFLVGNHYGFGLPASLFKKGWQILFIHNRLFMNGLSVGYDRWANSPELGARVAILGLCQA